LIGLANLMLPYGAKISHGVQGIENINLCQRNYFPRNHEKTKTRKIRN